VPEPAFLTVTCPSCSTTSRRVPAAFAGRKVKCVECGVRFLVPGPQAEQPTASPAPTFIEEAPAPTILETPVEEPPAATVVETPVEQPPAPTVLETRVEEPPAPTVREAQVEDVPAPTVLEGAEAPTLPEQAEALPTVLEGALAPTLDEGAAVPPTVLEGQAAPQVTTRGGVAWNAGDVVLGLYEVKGVLGEGGMGRVYRVHHRGWNLDLAVKAPLPSVLAAAGGADLFEREAETWVGLGLHPHVVTCYYVRRVNGLPLVFAEYVDGGSLHGAIREKRLTTVETILDVAIQLAWGLHHAHEQGLVHRDVKPANVMLTTEGDAKVTDFGLARARSTRLDAAKGAASGHTLTVEGGGGGTLAYLSPEQALGETLSRRSDAWSFGLCVLEMFLGARTWEYGLAAGEVLEAYKKDGLVAPGMPAMPEKVKDLLDRCFRQDPEERPHDTAEAAAELRAAWEAAAGRAYPRRQPKAGRGSPDALNNRAVSLVDLGRADEAATLWRRALDAEPQHVEATYNQTLAAWAEARLADTEVLRRMEEACASHASSARAHQLHGRLLMALGRGPEATIAFERAVALGRTEEADRELAAARVQAPAMPRVLRGLPGAAAALALSPDGHAVVASSGPTIRIWDAATGQPLRSLSIPEGAVRCLAFTPDGQFLIVGAENAPLTMWEVATYRLARSWARHAGFATSLAVVPGGRLVVSGGSDRIVRLFDVASGRCLHEMAGHDDPVTAVAAGPTILASASRDGTVRLWSIDDGRALAVLRDHPDRVLAVAVSEPKARLVSACGDGVVRDWGLQSHELVRSFVSHAQTAQALALSPAGHRFFSGAADSTVREIDADAGRVVSLLRLDSAVQALAFARDGTLWAAHGTTVSQLSMAPLQLPAAALCRPASAVEEEARATSFGARLDEARQAIAAGEFRAAVDRLRAARLIPGHERAEAALALWDDLCGRLPRRGLQSVWELAPLEGHTEAVTAVATDASGKRALTAGQDSTVRLWDLDSRRCVATLTGHEGGVSAVALAADGLRGLSGGRDRTLRLWDLTGAHSATVLEGHSETVTSLDITPDGARAASASMDGTVHTWDLRKPGPLHVLKGHGAQVTAVRYAADGLVLASAGWDGTVRLWDLQTSAELASLQGHEGNVTAVALHPAGRQVASGGEDRTVRLWDPRARRLLRTLVGHESEVTGLAFTPDGRFLLSASRDRSVRVWDLRRGETTRSLPHPAAVLALCVLYRGTELLTGSSDGSARVWHLDWDPETEAVAAAPPLPTVTPRSVSVGPRATSMAPTAAPYATRRMTLRDDLRRAAPRPSRQVLPAAGAAARRIPWRWIGLGVVILASLVVGYLAWRRPAHRVRLSPYMALSVPTEVNLVDLGPFTAGCSPDDYQHHLDQLRGGNPEAGDIACIAASSSPGVADDVLEAAPLAAPEALTALRLRRNAASILAGLKGDAVSRLCPYLGDNREDVRAVASLALGVNADPAATACVQQTLISGTPLAKEAGTSALRQQLARRKIQAAEGFTLIDGLLHDPDPGVRQAGLNVLTLYAFSTAEPAARALLQDPDPNVADAARRTLETIENIHRTDQIQGDTGG
jgi:WD40 repeat protein/serine/threonine protein kinase